MPILMKYRKTVLNWGGRVIQMITLDHLGEEGVAKWSQMITRGREGVWEGLKYDRRILEQPLRYFRRKIINSRLFPKGWLFGTPLSFRTWEGASYLASFYCDSVIYFATCPTWWFFFYLVIFFAIWWFLLQLSDFYCNLMILLKLGDIYCN